MQDYGQRSLLGCSLPLFVAVVLAGAATSAPAQTVAYNITSDWSDVNNPNGVWRLYKNPTTLFATNQADYWSDSTGQHAWADQPFQQTAHVPVWMKLTSPQSGFASTGTVIMHTAETSRTGTEYSSLTWTSPSAGQAQLFGGAWMQQVFDRPQTWEIRLNGISLTQGNLFLGDPYTQSNPYLYSNGSGGASALNLTVNANDVVELRFFRQSQSTPGTFVGFTFGVNFTSVPEPKTVTLLAAAVVVLGVLRIRRRY